VTEPKPLDGSAPVRHEPDPDGLRRYKWVVGTRARIACDGAPPRIYPSYVEPEPCPRGSVAITTCGTSTARCPVHLRGWRNVDGCGTLAAIDPDTGAWRPTHETWEPTGPFASDWAAEPYDFDW
jgi:hypothetical protein